MSVYQSMGFGYRYQRDATTFKVYAKDCNHLEVCLYNDADTHRRKEYAMQLTGDCIWELKIDGDLNHKYYVYRVHRGIEVYLATDPFAIASSVNSQKSAIIDLEEASVEGFDEDVFMAHKPREAIIYETHIRDMTMDPELGLEHPGKYLGVAEEVSKIPYGLSYIKDLGITHLHFLPLQDFLSIDELDANAYNWGYDPEQYFVPEGSYSTNPKDPLSRIRELRTMVKACHDHGLAVVLDVVYNHTYRGGENPLAILAPFTYYRHAKDGSYTNGSGCGNELNTEHPMVQQLIIDSLLHWAKVFHIDGFRFDLMALMDVKTAHLLVDEVRKINPNAIIYGEPWTGAESGLHWEKQVLKGRQHALKIALFNDDYRNALKGDNDGKDHGFVQGYKLKMHDIKTGIVGSIQYDQNHRGFCIEPWETVNYMSAHDNLCLFDKLKYSTMWSDYMIKEATKLGMALILLAFGVPFLQAGSEMMRTKQMDHNSYRSNDAVNAIRWNQVHENKDLVDYTRNLITLRKYLKCYDTFSAKDVQHKVHFLMGHTILAYSIDIDLSNAKKATVFVNPLHHGVEVKIKRTPSCRIIFNHHGLNLEGHKTTELEKSLKLSAFETLVLLS